MQVRIIFCVHPPGSSGTIVLCLLPFDQFTKKSKMKLFRSTSAPQTDHKNNAAIRDLQIDRSLYVFGSIIATVQNKKHRCPVEDHLSVLSVVYRCRLMCMEWNSN